MSSILWDDFLLILSLFLSFFLSSTLHLSVYLSLLHIPFLSLVRGVEMVCEETCVLHTPHLHVPASLTLFSFPSAPNSSCNARSEFQCSNGECIDYELACDGVAHCQDRSDEEGQYCGERHRETLYTYSTPTAWSSPAFWLVRIWSQGCNNTLAVIHHFFSNSSLTGTCKAHVPLIMERL